MPPQSGAAAHRALVVAAVLTSAVLAVVGGRHTAFLLQGVLLCPEPSPPPGRAGCLTDATTAGSGPLLSAAVVVVVMLALGLAMGRNRGAATAAATVVVVGVWVLVGLGAWTGLGADAVCVVPRSGSGCLDALPATRQVVAGALAGAVSAGLVLAAARPRDGDVRTAREAQPRWAHRSRSSATSAP